MSVFSATNEAHTLGRTLFARRTIMLTKSACIQVRMQRAQNQILFISTDAVQANNTAAFSTPKRCTRFHMPAGIQPEEPSLEQKFVFGQAKMLFLTWQQVPSFKKLDGRQHPLELAASTRAGECGNTVRAVYNCNVS